MAYCVKCGNPHEDGAAFCSGCGAAFHPGATAPATVAQTTATLAATPPVKRRLVSSRRAMMVAIVAIVAVAAVVIAGFAFLGSVGLSGKSMVAFARYYEGTWVEQRTGNKAIIDTTGGTARISIIDGSDGSQVLTVKIDGDNISIAYEGGTVWSAKIDGGNISASINGNEMSLSKNVLEYTDSHGEETHTFVRQ